jgi:hypothetical protein
MPPGQVQIRLYGMMTLTAQLCGDAVPECQARGRLSSAPISRMAPQ